MIANSATGGESLSSEVLSETRNQNILRTSAQQKRSTENSCSIPDFQESTDLLRNYKRILSYHSAVSYCQMEKACMKALAFLTDVESFRKFGQTTNEAVKVGMETNSITNGNQTNQIYLRNI